MTAKPEPPEPPVAHDEEERAGLLAEEEDSQYDSADISEKPGYVPGHTWGEAKILFPIAWQTVLATVLQSMTQQVTVLFVGHIGVVELGAAALASMWVNITGVSIVYGGASALDSLASQAFGAKSYTMVGLWAMRFLMIVSLMCIPICCSWWFGCAPVLRLIGIDEPTALAAQTFSRVYVLWMWPTFANRAMQSFLRAQGVVRPVSIITTITLCIHIPVTTNAIPTTARFPGMALRDCLWFSPFFRRPGCSWSGSASRARRSRSRSTRG